MRKNVGVVVTFLLWMVIGCSGQAEQDNADVDTSSPLFEAMISTVLTNGTEVFCEYVEQIEDTEQFSCVHTKSGEIYLCVHEEDPEGEPFFHCEVAAEGETDWTPCEDFRRAGDGKSGRSCWAPPQDYCRDGCSDAMTWFCKDDASSCCWNGCDCFGCDWIEVSLEGEKPRCQRAGENAAQSEAECADFFAKLPVNYQECIQGNCDEATVAAMASSAACKDNRADFQLLICE